MKLEPIGTVVLRAMSAAVLIAVGTTAARSDPEPEAVTFHFEGAVSAVDVFSPSSDLGDFVTGSITFDPSTPATLDSPTRNVYFDAVTRFRFWTNGEEGIARQFD